MCRKCWILAVYKMIRIVIIGNSAAAFGCYNSLIKNQQNLDLTVISQEHSPAYRGDLLIDYLTGNIQEKELFLCDENFYEKNKIKLLKDSKVTGLNTKKNLVILKDNNKIGYDFLVIASGEKVNIPEISGNSKDGVFSVYALEDVKKIKERLLITDTVCIVAEPDFSLRLAEVLAQKEKFVKVISSPKPPFFIQTEKCEWIDNLQVSEIIGEGAELKALKLSNGKAIGTSLVLFAGNYIPCTEFLKESGIKMLNGYICVDNTLRTNIENIFACGSACKNETHEAKEKSWEEAGGEGDLAASVLTNRIFSLTQPLKSV